MESSTDSLDDGFKHHNQYLTFWSTSLEAKIAYEFVTWLVEQGEELWTIWLLIDFDQSLIFSRVDSVMLLQEGFELVSVDASDKMLKSAYKTRWDRRKEDVFDKWSKFILAELFFFIKYQPKLPFLTVIEEANWLTLEKDIESHIEEGFDAIVCMGNSFAHLPDFHGDQREQQLAIDNFYKVCNFKLTL